MLFITWVNLALAVIYWCFSWKGTAPVGLAVSGAFALSAIAGNLVSEKSYPNKKLWPEFLNILVVLAMCFSFIYADGNILRFSSVVAASITVGSFFASIWTMSMIYNNWYCERYMLIGMLSASTALCSLPLISYLFF
jgi:hypothetical protein